MSNPSSSYANIPHPSTEEEVDSLPSSDAGSTTSGSDYDDSDADAEWRESLQQLELLLTMVLVPYVGKYFGRKCAYWGKISHVYVSAQDGEEVLTDGW